MSNKYNAKKTSVDGITFDSKAEARRYQELKLLERGGVIRNLELQPKYELMPAFVDVTGKKQRAMHYVADFRYVDERGVTVVEDVKGVETAVFKLKRKLMLQKGIVITLVK